MTKVYFKNIDSIIKTMLNESDEEIFIAVAWITDKKIIKVLENCLDRGVSINIIFFKDKINKIELFENLYLKGANIRYSTLLMHNKFCVIDNKIVINGSYNWTNSAKFNSENIQITESLLTAMSFISEFKKLAIKTTTIDRFFSDRQELFDKYVNEIGLPDKYPLFFRQDLDQKLKKKIFNINDNYLEFEDQNLYYPVALINFYYILFYDKESFLKHLYSVFKFLYTIDNRDVKISSILNIKDNSTDKSTSSSFMTVLDIIKDNQTDEINDIDVDNYINNDVKFSNEKFIYLDEFRKDKILLISFALRENIKDNIKILIINNSSNCNRLEYIFRFHEISVNKQTNKLLIKNRYVEEDMEWRIKYSYIYFIDLKKISFNKEDSVKIIEEKTNFYIEELQIKNEEKRLRKIESDRKTEQFIRESDEKARILKLERNNQYSKKQECYIATMIYNDINHPNIYTLRNFRDEVLLKHKVGVLAIKIYYTISPLFVQIFKSNKVIVVVLKFIIENIVLRFIKMKIKYKCIQKMR